MRVRASASWVSLSTCQPNQTRLSLPYPLFFFFAAVNVCLTYSPPTVGDGCCVGEKEKRRSEAKGGGKKKDVRPRRKR